MAGITFLGKTFDYFGQNPQAKKLYEEGLAKGFQHNIEYYKPGGREYNENLFDWQKKVAIESGAMEKLGLTDAQIINNPQLTTDAQALAKYKGISLADAQARIASLGGLSAPTGGPGSYATMEITRQTGTGQTQPSTLASLMGGKQPQSYVVKQGDTLSAIAKKYGVNVSDITGYKSGDPNLIYPGEQLTIKASPAVSTSAQPRGAEYQQNQALIEQKKKELADKMEQLNKMLVEEKTAGSELNLARIKSELESLTGKAPTKLDWEAEYNKLKEQDAVKANEKALNDINAEIASAKSAIRGEENRLAPMDIISSRQAKGNQILNDLYDRKSVLTEERNMQLNSINTIMNLKQQSYNDAVADYNTRFSQAIQIQNLINGEKDDNRAVWSTIMSSVKGKDLSELPQDTKNLLMQLEMKSGMPTGITEAILSSVSSDFDIKSIFERDGVVYMVGMENGQPKMMSINTGAGSKDIGDVEAQSIERKLISSRGTDGYVDPEVYQSLKRRSKMSPTEFDSRFKNMLNPSDIERYSIGKSTEPNQWEYDAMIWQWLATDGANYSDEEKRQQIMMMGRDPDKFGFYRNMATLQDYIQKNRYSIPSIPNILKIEPTVVEADENVTFSDVARELKPSTGKVLRWVGKQLMKPVGTVATTILQGREASEKRSIEPLKKIPEKIGLVLSGKEEHDFIEIYKKQLKEDFGIDSPVASAIFGTIANIVADPLNLVGGVTTKGLSLLEKGASKLKLLKWIKPSFSTKTGVKEFDALIDEYKSLGEYRKAQVIEDARQLQKVVSELPKDDIIKVSNYIEKGIESTPKVNSIALKLKNTFNTWKSLEKELGVEGGEIAQYVPHIKTQIPLMESIKKAVFPSKQWSTKLGGAEKGRTILKFVSEEGDELIGKADNLGLKEVVSGYKDVNPKSSTFGKIFSPEAIPASKMNFVEKQVSGFTDKAGKFYKSEQASISEISEKFGKVFFEENPAIQMAYRGLSHTKAVTSKEFFNAIKKFAIKDGIETAIPELKGLKFTEEIAKQLDYYYKGIQPEELRMIAKTFDGIQNWWKAQALLAPSYHLRNMVGNVWNNFLAGIKNPISYIQSGRMQMGKLDFDIAGKSAKEILEIAKKRGVINQGWYASDIPSLVEGGIKSTWKKGVNPLSQENYGFRLNKTIGSAFENNARLAHFIDKLKSGSTVDDAVLSTKKYLFDYQDLTNFERNVLKRVIPFYTWTRKNVPLQLEHLIKQPEKYAGLEKVVRGIENILMGNSKPANEKYLSDYILNNTAMRVGYDKEDNTYYYFLLGNWLPSYQAMDFLSEPLYNLMAMVTPIIKTPLELLMNKSSFFRNTLKEYDSIERYPGETVNYLGFNVPKKVAVVLRNIRILNELDKLNPGKIFGGKKGEPSVFEGLPGVNVLGVGIISPSKYKYSNISPAPSQAERITGTVVGKLQQYKVSEAKENYQRDTEKRIQELKSAIKTASKKGDSERVKILKKQLNDFKKSR